MKKYIIAVSLLTIAACTKPSSNTTNTTSSANKVTVTDNGTVYTDSGVGTLSPTQPYVLLSVQKFSTGSVLSISTITTSLPFYLGITAENGPASGIGSYVIYRNTTAGQYIENFNGGQSYTVDTAVFTTTTCGSSNVSGTFTMWLSNTSGSKTVTGSFNCNQPSIQ